MQILKNQQALEKSSIVANSLMNRERVLSGGNSYEKELSFEIRKYLEKRSKNQNFVNWLDICCGRGKALIEAARIFRDLNITITGIDLAGMFDHFPNDTKNLNLIETPFENFKPQTDFDLITCVHGLHYIGDKLGFIQKAVSYLKLNGIFLANLDTANFKTNKPKPLKRKITELLRENNLEFDSRKHLLTCKGKKNPDFQLKYIGANDQAGANYTKQAVVDSYYE